METNHQTSWKASRRLLTYNPKWQPPKPPQRWKPGSIWDMWPRGWLFRGLIKGWRNEGQLSSAITEGRMWKEIRPTRKHFDTYRYTSMIAKNKVQTWKQWDIYPTKRIYTQSEAKSQEKKILINHTRTPFQSVLHNRPKLSQHHDQWVSYWPEVTNVVK